MIEREEVEAQAQALDALAEMPLEGENTDPFIEVMRLCGHRTAIMLRTLLVERDVALSWQSAVERWFIGWHQVPDSSDPYEQICKMLAWEQKVALDPAVSAGDAKLVKTASPSLRPL